MSFVTVVSGIPRSGTSMMMKMLTAGGMEIVTDNERKADEDNPKGYFEFEKVKELSEDNSWIGKAQGKAIKVISQLLYHLPPQYQYKVVFVHREMDEILASQKKMLERRGQPTDLIDDAVMARKFRAHVDKVVKWIDVQPNMDAVYVTYHEVVADPLTAAKDVQTFLGSELDPVAMASAVDTSLYRNRT
jgi:hypothetical protein